MILQSLVHYYDRLLTEDAVQPSGFQEKEIPWVIEINGDGRFVRLIRTGGENGRGRRFVVPYEVKRSGDNFTANLLWDNLEYVLGVPRPKANAGQLRKVVRRHAAFVERLRSLPNATRNDPGVAAVERFLAQSDWSGLKAAEEWNDLVASGTANISFLLKGDADLVCAREAVCRYVEANAITQNSGMARCLVTGEQSVIARTHNRVKGVRAPKGQQSRDTDLVSFNEDAFRSHGWSQGQNAPVGERAAHAYVAALNWLLHRDHASHHFVEGDTTYVFWAEAKTTFEDEFAHLLGGYAEQTTDDDGTAARNVLESVRKGIRPHIEDPTPFCVLGLAPNAARLAVRYWHIGPVGEMAGRILAHFDDLDVTGLDRDRHAGAAWRLISAAAVKGKLSSLQDQFRGRLFSELLAAVLDGRPYPDTLLARAVERCRAEQAPWPVRVAVIKAVLCRRARTAGSIEREVTVSLDRENRSPGYRLGRLFAVLEGIQRVANPNINTTIRDRYFGAATTTPRAVFTELMRLKTAHLRKVRRAKPGLAVHFEKTLDEIMNGFDGLAAFPAHLGLEEQGRFVVGYHHQRSSVASDVPEADATELDSSETEASEE